MAEIRLNESEQRVQAALLSGEYEEALTCLTQLKEQIRPLYQALFEASAALALKDRPRAWSAVSQGLALDHRNYELYMMLGEYYAAENLRQAYLCYENALFYCDAADDREQIRLVMEQLRSLGGNVPKTAIVIPFYNLPDMTDRCLESIFRTTPDTAREIILVDDGSLEGCAEQLKSQRKIKLVRNGENTGYTAACNRGISAAEADSDIFLLNNDTLLTDNAFFWLRMGLYESEQAGSAGCVANHAANFQTAFEDGRTEEEYVSFAKKNNVPMENPYRYQFLLSGYALLLKRDKLKEIGFLDERFWPGGFEDNDICLRMSLAGYRNVLCKNSFIIHWGEQSYGKDPVKYGEMREVNGERFFQKWAAAHLGPQDYWNTRLEIVGLLRDYYKVSDGNIMVVGTRCGGILSRLQDAFPHAGLYGMEQNPYMAQIASQIADTVCADYDEWKGDDLAETFSYIIVNDVLEQTAHPGALLAELHKMLKKDGHLVVSFANRRHYSRIERADADSFFDRETVYRLLASSGFLEEDWVYTRAEDGTPKLKEKVGEVQKRYPRVSTTELFAYQWLVTASKQRTDIQFHGKLVLCIPTCGHPEAVEDILERYAELYHRYGLDVYYYDSSSDGKTKEVIKKYQERGFDNLFYIAVSPKLPVLNKIESIMAMRGIPKEYEYMWYLKDRIGMEERFLQIVYRAMEEPHDLIFLDSGNRSNTAPDTQPCRDADEFYHRCGTWATNMGNAIYHVKSMLKDDFEMEEFLARHGEYKGSFFHFLIIFEQLAKKECPDICLMAGRKSVFFQSDKSDSGWHKERIDVWGDLWIQANEALPDCYTDKDNVIKRTASLPWILDDADALVDLHEKGILTPEYYEEIKTFWTRVSNIPLADLRKIAYGEYVYIRHSV